MNIYEAISQIEKEIKLADDISTKFSKDQNTYYKGMKYGLQLAKAIINGVDLNE